MEDYNMFRNVIRKNKLSTTLQKLNVNNSEIARNNSIKFLGILFRQKFYMDGPYNCY